MNRKIFLLSISLIAGCANLSAVRDISSQLLTAASSWDSVTGEIAGSCRRQLTLNSQLTDCKIETQASDGLSAANGVLISYFKALKNAASDSNFTIQPGLSNATESIAKIPGINADQVKAASGLFGLLARLATEKMRESVLHELIGEGAPAAQTVISAMNEVVVPQLRTQLDGEGLQLQGQFGRLIHEAKDRIEGNPSKLCEGSSAAKFSGTGFLLTQEYCRRQAIVDQRIAALAAYQATLKSTNDALAELQSSKTKLGAAALTQRLLEIGAELEDKVSALQKAFK